MRRAATTCARGLMFAALMGLGLGACSGDDNDGKPCPTNGIGADEIENWDQYGCTQPQICPDVGWVAVIGYPVSPDSPKRQMAVQLTNCSKGNTKLVIEKVVLKGNSRCYMSEPQIEDREIDPGKGNSKTIAVTWKPEKVGRDDAALFIHSNAQNKPILEVPLCGTAVAPKVDGGVNPSDAGVVDPEAGPQPFQCKPVTKDSNCP